MPTAKGDEAVAQRIFEAGEEKIADVLGFVEGELEKACCPLKIINSVCVAMEEVFVNIAHYAYPEGGGTVKISVDINESARTAIFTVIDSGIAFDPLKKSDPDITLPAEQRKIGGLGIFIVKKTMDSLGYTRENGENILTMTKNFES